MAAKQEPTATESTATPALSPQQMEEAIKVFSVLRDLGVNSNNLSDFGSLAKSVLKQKQADFTHLIAGIDGQMGLVEYAKNHLDADEMDEFKSYITQQASTFSRPAILMKVSASLLSNYQSLLAKGVAEQQKAAEKKVVEETRRVPSNTVDWVGQNTEMINNVFNAHTKKMRSSEEVPVQGGKTGPSMNDAKDRLASVKPTIAQVE